MIDTVAKAIMKWCVPFNDWDAITESQREQFRGAARAAIDAMPHSFSEVRETYGEPIKGTRSERVFVLLSQLSEGTTTSRYSFRTQEEDGTWTYWKNVAPEKIVDGYAIFNLTDENRVTPR